jgi:Sulfotransferase family
VAAEEHVADVGKPAGGSPVKRVPDFFIAGHQKCGTTALYLMLKNHPQIFLPENKEPRYFATDLRSRFPARAPAAKALRTLDGYLSLFDAARPDQLLGDASPQYLRSRAAPGNIAEMVPAARIVAILREPASFLRSFHMQMVSSNVEDQRDLRKAIGLEQARREGKRIPRRCYNPDELQYSDHVHYVEQLRRYHETFGAENVLVLIYDDFRRDNEGTVRAVLRFLGVDDTVPVDTIDTKPLKEVRSLQLHHLANAARKARTNPVAAGPASRALNALTPRPLRSDAFRALWRRVVYRAPRPPDEAFMLELRRRFRPEVLALSDYLNRDLTTLWGYDSIR